MRAAQPEKRGRVPEIPVPSNQKDLPSMRHLPTLAAGLRLLIRPVAVSLLTLWFSAAGLAWSSAAARAALTTGNHVPDLSFRDLEGRSRTITWTGGASETTIFFFFEFRSAPSVFGLTYLDSLYRRAGDFGLDILAVETSGLNGNAIGEALEKYKTLYPAPPFTIVPDPDGSLRGLFGVSKAPRLFVVERHGVIFFDGRGFDDRTGDRVSEKVGRILRLPAGVLEEDAPAPPSDPGTDESSEPAQRILFPGDKVPTLSVTDLEGGQHTLDWSPDRRRMAVIFFWGESCRPCIEEMLFLDQLAGRARDLGLALEIWSVADRGLDAPATRAAMEKYATLYPPPILPIILDVTARLSEVFGPGEPPSTFLINGEGTLLSHADEFNDMVVGEWIGLIEQELPRAGGALLPLLE